MLLTAATPRSSLAIGSIPVLTGGRSAIRKRSRTNMNRNEYLSAVNEFMYQGEVFGEAILASYLALEKDAERRYKWATLMQLETETKARLRPFLARLGLSVAQDDVSDKVAGFAKAYASKSWQQHMKEVGEITDFYIAKFREIDAAAPPEER